MRKTLLAFISPLLFLFTQAQPKLAGTVAYHGSREGGTIFRYDQPSNTPGVIHTFDNFTPHRPMGGVCKGNGNWLYGVLQFNGTDNHGGLYKIQQDGTGFTVLYNMDGTMQEMKPYYH